MHLHSLPAPFSVFWIVCKPPHVEIRLDHFWSLYVILLSLTDGLRFSRTIKTERFRAEFCTCKNGETMLVKAHRYDNGLFHYTMSSCY